MRVLKRNSVFEKKNLYESFEEVADFWDVFFEEFVKFCDSYKARATGLKTKFTRSSDREIREDLFKQLYSLKDSFDEYALTFRKKIDALAMENKEDAKAYQEVRKIAQQYTLQCRQVISRMNDVGVYMDTLLKAPDLHILVFYKNKNKDTINISSGVELAQTLVDLYKNDRFNTINSFFITNKVENINTFPMSPDGIYLDKEEVSNYLKSPSSLLKDLKAKVKKKRLSLTF